MGGSASSISAKGKFIVATRWTGLSSVTRRAPDAPQMDPNRVAPARTAGRRRGRTGVRRPDEVEHLRDRLSRFRPTKFRLTMQIKIALSGLFFGTFLVAGGLFVAYLNADEARVEQLGLIGAFVVSLTSSATVVLPAPGILIILSMAEIIDPWRLGVVTGIGTGLGASTAYLAGVVGRGAMGESSRIKQWMTDLFHSRWGAVILVLGNLIPFAPGDAISAIAGISRFPVIAFFIYVIIASIIKMIALSWLGRIAPDIAGTFLG